MTAKVITQGNTLTVILPEGIHFADCDEAEIEMIGSEIRLAPKAKTEPEEVRYASNEEVKRISDELIKQNLEAYKELAK